MLVVTAPPPLLSPAIPLVVRRPFHRVAPYAAGGRRSILLAAHAGHRVAAPCAGTVRFVGTVAGSARVATIRCAVSGLLVTVGGGEPRVVSGAQVERGAALATVAGGALTLSVRRPAVGYVDPLPLLQARAPWPPPAVGLARWSGRRPGHLRVVPAEHLPAVHLDRAVRTAEAVSVDRSGGAAPDRWLGLVGGIAGLGALASLAVRRRRLAGRPATRRARSSATALA